MKKKQVLGMILAAVLFVGICVTSMLMNQFTKQLSSSFLNQEIEVDELPTEKYMGILDVSGTIQPSPETSYFQTTTGYDHNACMSFIDEMIEDSNNEGIVIYVDSPGGTVYEADELYLKLMEYKEKTERPIYAYFRSYACSGGYYIAMAADEIYANRNTTTGSIGVIISYYNYRELFEKIGISEENIVSGSNKAMGSAAQEMTQEQRDIYQNLVNESYEQFVDIVAKGRNMDTETVKKLADGRIYTASQAVENKLIDGIKTEQEFTDYIIDTCGDVTLYENKTEPGWFEELFGSLSQMTQKSDNQVLMELIEEQPFNKGLMYYAVP